MVKYIIGLNESNEKESKCRDNSRFNDLSHFQLRIAISREFRISLVALVVI